LLSKLDAGAPYNG
jgi:hypothetical protein